MAKILFGKYKSWDLCEVPATYLEYMLQQYEKNVEDFRTELQRRHAEEEANLPLVERIITLGYRAMAKEAHPDVGGSNEAMQELNETVETLRNMVRHVEASRNGK
jgi:hypothetical protein